MIFENRLIIIDNSQRRCRLDVEVIGGTSVIIVMDDRWHEEGESLEVWHPVLETSLRNNPVRAGKNIRCMKIVVVRIAIAENMRGGYITIFEG